MSDCASRVDGACYRRHHVQEFGRVLKTLPGIFLEEHLNENNDRLWNEVLLYDLTSTYFESDPVFEETDKRQFGYSRDKRPDCWPKYAFFHRFKLYSLTSSSRATCRCVLPLWIINSTPWRLKSSPYLRAILLFFTVVLILL